MELFGFGNPECPGCGNKTRKTKAMDGHIVWWCDNCQMGYDPSLSSENFDEDKEEYDECLSVEDAALIWLSNGKDEDYQCGYSEYELEEALRYCQ